MHAVTTRIQGANRSIVRSTHAHAHAQGSAVHSARLGLGLDGELEDDVLAAESAVDGREGVELVLKQVLVLGVKVGLAELGAVLGDAGAAAGDLGREDEVVERSVLDGGQGARAGALLAELGVRLARLLGQDAALADEDDVLVRQLLLELAGEAGNSSF